MGKGKRICIEQAASKHWAVSTHLTYIMRLNSLAITSFCTPVSNISEGSSRASGCCPHNLRNIHWRRQVMPRALRMEIKLRNTSLKSPHHVVSLTFLTHVMPFYSHPAPSPPGSCLFKVSPVSGPGCFFCTKFYFTWFFVVSSLSLSPLFKCASPSVQVISCPISRFCHYLL